MAESAPRAHQEHNVWPWARNCESKRSQGWRTTASERTRVAPASRSAAPKAAAAHLPCIRWSRSDVCQCVKYMYAREACGKRNLQEGFATAPGEVPAAVSVRVHQRRAVEARAAVAREAAQKRERRGGCFTPRCSRRERRGYIVFTPAHERGRGFLFTPLGARLRDGDEVEQIELAAERHLLPLRHADGHGAGWRGHWHPS